jgi:hypothetical protein
MNEYLLVSIFFYTCLIIGSTLTFIRFIFTLKLISKNLFYRLLLHHTLADLIFYAILFGFSGYSIIVDGNFYFEQVYPTVIWVEIGEGLSTVFALHFTFSGFLFLKKNDLYDRNYGKIILLSYLSPVVMNFIDVIGYEVQLSEIRTMSISYTIMLTVSIFACLTLIYASRNIVAFSRKEGLAPDNNNIIVFPMIQAVIWLVVMFIMWPWNFSSLEKDGNESYLWIISVLVLYPVLHFYFYFPQVYKKKTEEMNLHREIDMSDFADDSISAPKEDVMDTNYLLLAEKL